MSTTSKSSKKASPAAAAPKAEFVDAFTPLYLNSVERMAELQKKSWHSGDVRVRHRRAGG